MTEITVRKPLLNGFKDVELRPDLYRVDVLGAHVQVGINSEWQRMGETLVRRLDSHQKKAVLISTMNLEHFLTEEVETSNLDNSSSFEHEGKRYVVTFLDQSKLKQTLPDICKSEEFHKMYRRTETARTKLNRRVKKFEHLSIVLQMSKAMQTRFVLIPSSALNKVTVAGVRDMKLGRVKDGKHVGANVVRVNNPSAGTRSDFPRICIDPKGVSNRANPHIEISQGAVKAAENLQKGLKVTGKVLLVVSIVASGYRIAKAVYDEVDIDSEIKALREIVDCLEEDLKNMEDEKTREALEFAEELLDDAYDCKRNPGKKTLLTSLCIGGEWAGAAALGLAGAQGGAAIGSVGGPVGTIGGAVAGSVVGAIAGSELGSSAVENFRCDDDGLATEMQGNLIGFGEKDHAEILGLDGNVFIGKGVEVGARGALFEMKNEEEGKSLTYGKMGANVGLTNKGVDASVEGKVMWVEKETANTKVGVGLNVDTGFQANENGVGMSVLGLGFHTGDEGFSLKTPFFNFTWKS